MILSSDRINKNIDLLLDLEILAENYSTMINDSHASWIDVAKSISCTTARVWITSVAVEASKACHNRIVLLSMHPTSYNKYQLTVQLLP